MKSKSTFCIFVFFLFPIWISLFSITPIATTTNYQNPLLSSPDYGVSNFTTTQSVKYQVEINFTLTHNSGGSNYYFKFARLNNRVPNSSLTRYTPPYQKSELLYNNISGFNPTELTMGHNDKFNNTYDSFNATLAPSEKVSLSQKYNVTLNAIRFQTIEDSDIGTYNMSDEIFDLYCNHTEPYYERDDLTLIALSNSIVDPSDNPVEKALKIYTWVSQNIVYDGGLPAQEKGALWAYNNLAGDCSEYSSLMITLLRIQDIPARKVTGFLISNNPRIRPQVNKTYEFHISDSESDILGHAWIEYYVSGIGWIACDPTWNSATNYFNRIDFLRFNRNIGANFFFPPHFTDSEFNTLFTSTSTSCSFDYTIKITVLESSFAPLTPLPLLFFVFIGIGVAAIAVTVLIIVREKRKK
ncbi:MAG: transglutaminase-like domain-containing protein [Promethearchaeota archaeon]|jgi:transglutaminase-like putative cysteine protease